MSRGRGVEKSGVSFRLGIVGDLGGFGMSVIALGWEELSMLLLPGCLLDGC
jgi:hypothetical protein